MDALPSKKEQFQKSFLELQSHSAALVDLTVKWKELDYHFNNFEKLLQKRSEELERKGMENEKEKKSAAGKSTGNLNKTSEKESTAEKSSGNSNKISDKKSIPDKSIGNPNKTSEKTCAAEKSAGNPKNTLEKTSAPENSTGSPNKTLPVLKNHVNPRPKLKSLCEKMDGEGLKKFLVGSRRQFKAIGKEVPAALRCAVDPAKLVLQTLEGFYSDDKAVHRHGCDLLLSSLPFVISPDNVSSEAKKDAQKIAAAWKSYHNLDAESGIYFVEAHAFLQLLVSYGISKEFKDDDICELIVRISAYPDVLELCRALQISHKIPDVVEKLIHNRNLKDAIRFVGAFGLLEKFPPVPLLKAYLEDEKKVSENEKKVAQELANRGVSYIRAENGAATRKIDSLKTVIKFIQEHNLESQMSSKDFEERVKELQTAKAERRRSAKDILSQD